MGDIAVLHDRFPFIGGAETFAIEDVRQLLSDYHDIQRIEMEIAQPDRLNEVLAEMVRRDVIEATDQGDYRLR